MIGGEDVRDYIRYLRRKRDDLERDADYYYKKCKDMEERLKQLEDETTYLKQQLHQANLSLVANQFLEEMNPAKRSNVRLHVNDSEAERIMLNFGITPLVIQQVRDNPKVKTIMCANYNEGSCKYNGNCSFIHGPDEYKFFTQQIYRN